MTHLGVEMQQHGVITEGDATAEFDAPEISPCFEPARKRRRPRPPCRFSLSIVALSLIPTVCIMTAVAAAAWFMIYDSALSSIEATGKQGQKIFLKAVRDSMLSYTAGIQRALSVQRPRWENTTCDGLSAIPGHSAFDAYDDVRMGLYSETYYLTKNSSTVALAFPCGSYLAYEHTPKGNRWTLVDNSTHYWMRQIYSNSWQADWASGPNTTTKPADLVASGQPLNMSQQVWYANAVHNGNQSWAAIANSLSAGGLAIIAVLPVYYPSGALKLVAMASITLQHLDTVFTASKLTPNTFAFAAELDGNLVASTPEGLSTAVPTTATATGAVGVRVAAQHAGDARISSAAQWLIAQFGSLSAVPTDDTDYAVQLAGKGYYLFTGHVQDGFGLHWVIVIGVPRSDLLQGLDDTSVSAMWILGANLLATLGVLGLVTFAMRRNLQRFAERIQRMGTMDLEGAMQVRGFVFLSEARLILRSLQQTIDNLQQFRTFLPPTMLDKVRQAEQGDQERPPEGPRLARSFLGMRMLAHASQDDPSRSMYTSHLNAVNAANTAIPAVTVAQVASPPPAHPHSVVRCTLDRRMESLWVTLVSLELPLLHSAVREFLAASDFMLWYETCLSTALNIAQREHGEFHRLTGDQLLFSWGAVRRVAAQGSKACRAAWELRAALRALDAGDAPPVKYGARLSVVTGAALCGVMGTATTRDLYLVGPLIKQAARLTALNHSYDTHILVDSGIAQDCETLFRMQVCGFVYGASPTTAQLPQPVFELLNPVLEGEESMMGRQEQEWLYKLAPQEDGRSLYNSAMDALRRGEVQQVQELLEAFLALSPEDRHAHRVLQRIASRPPDATGLAGLID
eukprot:EG_transcript_1471